MRYQGEEILGQLLRGMRDRFVPSTRYTVTRDRADPNAAGNHRKNLRQSRGHLGSPPGVGWSCTFAWPSLCMCGRARSVSSASPRRIWGFRRCLSRSQLTAPLARLPLDYAERRDRKHGRRGDVGGKGVGYSIGAG
jgi:hypothetical protein